jgi:proteic killer suppression protein
LKILVLGRAAPYLKNSELIRGSLNDVAGKKIPSNIEDRLFRKLQLIDDATSELDLRSPPSNHFEKLRGKLANSHSIRVNKQWRLVFNWSNTRGEATELYLDNHDYR